MPDSPSRMDLSNMAGVGPKTARQQQHQDSRGGPENNSVGDGVKTPEKKKLPFQEYPTYKENGREYHGFRQGMYMYPCDDREQNRLDILHKVFSVARHEQLHNAPLNSSSGNGHSGPRVLDLGCGTGIWAVEMARKYRDAYVLGVDLSAIQPQNPPENCEFQAPKDFESPWLLGDNSWDLVRIQLGCGSVSSWPNLYRKAFAHLRPGGYFEQVEIDFAPQVDGGLSEDHPLLQWYQNLRQVTTNVGKSIALNKHTSQMLEDAGFEAVQWQVVGLPLNTWPTDPHEREVGKWYNLAFSEGTSGLLMGPMTRAGGWTMQQVEKLASDVDSQAYNKHFKAWNLLHIYTARKPVGSPR